MPRIHIRDHPGRPLLVVCLGIPVMALSGCPFDAARQQSPKSSGGERSGHQQAIDDAVANIKSIKKPEIDFPKPKSAAADGPELDGILDELNSSDNDIVRAAIAELQRSGPNNQQKAIAAKLSELCQHQDRYVSGSAAVALARWATVDNIDALIASLEDDSFVVRNQAIDALVRLKDARGAEAIVGVYRQNNMRAKKGLVAMGPVAEAAVLRMLDNQEWTVRLDACRILKDIGGGKSKRKLQSVAKNDKNGLVKMKAKEAAGAIR